MSINEFVKMTILLCVICFSIYEKMQDFIDESGCFFFWFFFVFYAEIQDGRQKWGECGGGAMSPTLVSAPH